MPQPPTHIYPPHAHYMSQHLPLMNIPIPPSILKKTSIYSGTSTLSALASKKDPPGVPPFPPPDFSSDDEDFNDRVINNCFDGLKKSTIFYLTSHMGKLVSRYL